MKTAWISLLAIASSMVAPVGVADELVLDRDRYREQLEGFWLGQSIANWTGLITEMDKIGGEGIHGEFYTREHWGGPDHPNIWSPDGPSHLSPVIDWLLVEPGTPWGADDDTDIEYIYQHLLVSHEATVLTGEQIRDGWMAHIYSDENTPFRRHDGVPENYLWVSNQRAHDLMRVEGLVPPATSDPAHNPDFEMIDAQLTTEIFGVFAPGRPDVALRMAYLPIRTTAGGEAALASEFYVIMHALAASVRQDRPAKDQVFWMAGEARAHLPNDSISAKMHDFVKAQYDAGASWEAARDAIYQRYQVEQADGYDITSRGLECNGCFASGINFAASMISLYWGEGDYQETVKIAVLAGWDSDNPAATWGGLLGFMMGRPAIETLFGRPLSDTFHIHRTRGGFPNDGMDSFPAMAERGARVVDRVVRSEMGGEVVGAQWRIPEAVRQP